MSQSASILEQLRAYESRNVTFMAQDGSWPIVWDRACGAHVWDLERRRFLDLTAAFGVAAAGHANPRVVAAGQQQMARLLHAMGDVHPHPLKAALARELSRITFERWTPTPRRSRTHSPSPSPNSRAAPPAGGKVIFGNSGFEAVEAALKTAMLATQRAGVIAFEGGYHGLGYGALTATQRAHFRRPFLRQLRPFVRFVPFPLTVHDTDIVLDAVGRHLDEGRYGAVLVEPVQGRGGIRVPPPAFLPALEARCRNLGVLLVLDEVYTGFGRTGRWFACEHTHTVPDLICLGKALTGGFPLSACVGRADLMDAAWPESDGEAIHTSTFLGHPVGCAMALAQIREIGTRRLEQRAARLGAALRTLLRRLRVPPGLRAEVRGLGLMVGLALTDRHDRPASTLTLRVIAGMLRRGFILLPEGEAGNVISFTPPLTISERQLTACVRALEAALDQAAIP